MLKRVLLNLSANHTRVKSLRVKLSWQVTQTSQAALTKWEDFDAIVVPGYYTEAGKIMKNKRVVWELTNQSLVVMDSTVKSLYNKQPPEKASNIYFVSGF